VQSDTRIIVCDWGRRRSFMFQELKFQLSTAILTILTLAAGVSAFINFEQQSRFQLPEDGVIWVDRAGGVEALYVRPQSGGANAGVHPGDRLESIAGVAVDKASAVIQILVVLGPWKKTTYVVNHGGVSVPATVIVGEAPRALGYEYLVGLAYLVIGLFVYFRRGSAHKAQHFYILCLSSFIFFCFHNTRRREYFDKII
jgi:two-component system NtrC family sensor kinase